MTNSRFSPFRSDAGSDLAPAGAQGVQPHFGWIPALIHPLRRRRLKRSLRRATQMIENRDRDGLIELAAQVRSRAYPFDVPMPSNLFFTLLQRLCLFEHSWPYRIAKERQANPAAKPRWDGGDLSHRTILLRSNIYKNRIGEDIRFARFIQPVAQRAARCIVCTETRLVPILRRTFPTVEVRDRSDEAQATAEADLIADFGTLGLLFGDSAKKLEDSFMPLRADLVLAAALRGQYLTGRPSPLIGISWWSKKTDRDIPDLASWAPVLAKGGTFVSLQYGDVSNDLPVFRRLADRPVICDSTVDQLVDLDRFAAQVFAMDAVVAISNTTIDMAANLGVPTVQIRDDRQHGIWPPGAPTPWYPDLAVVYRDRRPWSEVMAEVAERLSVLLSSRRHMAWTS